MTLEQWIDTYGYGAILLGTFLEGETVLILGGFAAYQGYLKLPWVILAAFLGTLSGDQLFFYIGRNYGAKILARRPGWQVRVERVKRLLDRFQDYLILLFRFLYGLRIVTPFVLGFSRVPRRRFLVLNAVGALVWATAIGTGGFLSGKALEALMGNLKRYEGVILGLGALAGIAVWVIHGFRRRKPKGKRTGDLNPPK
jgi:membrane protein DedA with SNARE-associated domain